MRRVLIVAGFLVAFGIGSQQALAATFTNAAPISIPDSGPAGPYPSTILAGVDGRVVQARATLRGFTHTNPPDVDVLLVGPDGARTILTSDTCGGAGVTDLTFTFDDGAYTTLPDTLPCPSGTYRPTNRLSGDGVDSLPGPAPAGPYPAAMSALTGAAAGGTWSLFVNDDAAIDVGSFAGGWTLELLTDSSCAGKSATTAAQLGTNGAETIVGTSGPDVLIGLGGNDTINGLGGKDVICGGAGNDILLGGPGKDLLRGEAGRDKLKGQGGQDICIGGAKPDTAKACEKQKSI